jgi:DEAD/DEAH box helicase domain-containing protein
MHTTACWLTVPAALLQYLPFSSEEMINGLFGLAYLLHHVSPLFMMCDLHDAGVPVGDNLTGESVPPQIILPRVATFDENPVFSEPDFEPNIFIYDNYPGGIGLSPALFDLEKDLLRHSLKTINVCPCQEGCPSCVGPSRETGRQAKQVAQEILRGLLEE